MPIIAAKKLAFDINVSTDYLMAMFDHLNNKLETQRRLRRPTPLNTYRQLRIIGLALQLRQRY